MMIDPRTWMRAHGLFRRAHQAMAPAARNGGMLALVGCRLAFRGCCFCFEQAIRPDNRNRAGA